MIGIYKIENLVNHKIYIGQSRNIKDRWRAHRTRYQKEDGPLYRAIRKYGLENFSFEILEECSIEQLNDREKYWIKYYDSFNREKGYNLTEGGQNASTGHLTSEQIDLIYSLLKEDVSQQEIADKFNISQSMVSAINSGEYYVRVGVSYPIKQNHYERYCVDCGIQISKWGARCVKCSQQHQAQLKYEKGNYPNREELKQFIRTLPFTTIGKQYNVTDNAVRKWCQHYNLPYKKKDIKLISDEDWINI